MFFYFFLSFWIHNFFLFPRSSKNFAKENLMWFCLSYTNHVELLSTVALEMPDAPQVGGFWKFCFPGTKQLFFSICNKPFASDNPLQSLMQADAHTLCQSSPCDEALLGLGRLNFGHIILFSRTITCALLVHICLWGGLDSPSKRISQDL